MHGFVKCDTGDLGDTFWINQSAKLLIHEQLLLIALFSLEPIFVFEQKLHIRGVQNPWPYHFPA